MARRKDQTGLIVLLLVVVLVGLYFLYSTGNLKLLATTLGPEDWVEYRCEDVTPYLEDGYTFHSYDEHGCEIVAKNIEQTTSFQTPLYSCSCYPGCNSGPDDCSRNYEGLHECGGCLSGYKRQCCSYYQDFKGGYKMIINTCEYGPNDLLLVEGKIGPVTFDINDLQYPVKGFCKAHPAIITHEEDRTTHTSTTVYDDLLTEEPVSVADGDTLTLFYVIENNFQLPTVCQENDGLALNPETEQCVPSFGIVYDCTEGFFDPTLGLCVISPGIDYFCNPEDFGLPEDATMRRVEHTYLLENGSEAYNYTCEYTPPINYDCPDNSYYRIDNGTCVEVPDTLFECPDDAELHMLTLQECLDSGYRWLDCPGCPEGVQCTSCGTPRCEYGNYCEVEPTVTIEPNVSLSCPEDYSYSSELDMCIITPTSRIICLKGELVGGECVVEVANVTVKCPDGLTPVGGACVEFPAVDFYCAPGTVLSDDKKSCVKAPKETIICNSTYVYDEELNKCVYRPEQVIIGDLELPVWTLYLTFLVIIILIVALITKRKQ
jgi:hypothetical protein